MEYAAVLIAALFHAIWNAFLKQSGSRLYVLTYIRLTGLVAGGIILLSQGYTTLPAGALSFLLPAVIVHFIYYFFLLRAYHVSDFSFAYPVARGGAPVLVMLLSLVFGGDSLTNIQITGVAVTSFGIVLVSGITKLHFNTGLWLALATAFCIAGYTYLSGLGVRLTENFWVYAAWLEVGTGSGVVLFSSVYKGPASLFKGFKPNYLIIGIISVAAYVIALWAMSRISIAGVAVLRETSILFAALLAAVFLQEKFGKRKILATFIITAGVMILSRS